MNEESTREDRDLPLRTELLQLAGALGANDQALAGEAISSLGPESDDLVFEVLVTGLFVVGFPRVLSVAEQWATQRTAPAPEQARPMAEPGTAEQVTQQGWQRLQEVYGSQSQRLVDRLEHIHPDLRDLVVRLGYGEMMARPGMTLQQRELAMIAMLSTLGAPRQLYSHLRGGIGAGLSEADLASAIGVACNGDPGLIREALGVLGAVVARRREAPASGGE